MNLFRCLCIHLASTCWLFGNTALAQESFADGSIEATAAGSEIATFSEDIQRIIKAGRNGNQVQDHLDVMTNHIGPRLTGSQGLQTACEWADSKFKELGLQSRLEKWGEFPVGFERGPSYGWMLEPKPMNLNFGTNAWTAGTKGRQVGKAILGPQTMEELEALRHDIPGSYVLLPRRARRPRGNADSDESAADRRARYEMQQQIRNEIIQLGPAGIVRSTSDERILTGGNYQVDWDNLPKIPSINLLKEQWDEIAELVKNGEDVMLRFDIRNYFRQGPIDLYNVIADIPGSEFPDEYVIVGGHIDSWDGASGATDNASGCATTIEAARILMSANVQPRRTIRFMLWSGEEQGLLGSKAWVADNPKDVQNTSAVLVHDGGTNYVAGIVCLSPMREDFEKVFAPAMQLDDRTPFEIRDIETMRPRGGSDHVPFIRQGIPGFFWIQRGRATYRTTHHTQYDTFETVVPEYQRHSSLVIALGAYGISNLDTLLPREGIQGR